MLLLAAALTAVPVPAVAATDATASSRSKNCPRTTSVYAWRHGEPLSPRKLTQLPPANAYSAVYRRIGGCEVPVIVRYGVGGR